MIPTTYYLLPPKPCRRGYRRTLGRLRSLLRGGAAAAAADPGAPGSPRHLQSPLSFRTCAGVLGAADDALGYCEAMVGVELNAHQQNPLCVEAEDRVLSCGNFEMQVWVSIWGVQSSSAVGGGRAGGGSRGRAEAARASMRGMAMVASQ